MPKDDASECRWHVERWPALSWAETVVKLAAFGVAYATLTSAIGRPAVPINWTWRIVAQSAILGTLSVGLLLAICDRWRRREVVSMVFVLLNVPAHWGLFAAMLRTPDAHSGLVLFAWIMLVGDAVKTASFYVSPLPVRDLSPVAGTALTGIYLAGYAAIGLIECL
jgi:hypothetical protein